MSIGSLCTEYPHIEPTASELINNFLNYFIYFSQFSKPSRFHVYKYVNMKGFFMNCFCLKYFVKLNDILKGFFSLSLYHKEFYWSLKVVSFRKQKVASTAGSMNESMPHFPFHFSPTLSLYPAAQVALFTCNKQQQQQLSTQKYKQSNCRWHKQKACILYYLQLPHFSAGG